MIPVLKAVSIGMIINWYIIYIIKSYEIFVMKNVMKLTVKTISRENGKVELYISCAQFACTSNRHIHIPNWSDVDVRQGVCHQMDITLILALILLLPESNFLVSILTDRHNLSR